MAIETRARRGDDEVPAGDDGAPPRKRLLSNRAVYGYGPLVAFIVVFVLMAALLPSVVGPEEAETAGKETQKSAEELFGGNSQVNRLCGHGEN